MTVSDMWQYTLSSQKMDYPPALKSVEHLTSHCNLVILRAALSSTFVIWKNVLAIPDHLRQRRWSRDSGKRGMFTSIFKIPQNVAHCLHSLLRIFLQARVRKCWRILCGFSFFLIHSANEIVLYFPALSCQVVRVVAPTRLARGFVLFWFSDHKKIPLRRQLTRSFEILVIFFSYPKYDSC